MLTPYDWQEGIGNRAQYIEGKLERGEPIVAVSALDGVLLYTRRRAARKLFEIYDRLAFGALGQQSDVEAVRLAAVEFASREGYQRSEQDVTISRVVSAMSAPVKRAFADFGSAPFVMRCLLAEVNGEPADDRFFALDYTGDFAPTSGFAAVAGDDDRAEQLRAALEALDRARPAEAMLPDLERLWRSAAADGEDLAGEVEALLVARTDAREDRFRALVPSN